MIFRAFYSIKTEFFWSTNQIFLKSHKFTHQFGAPRGSRTKWEVGIWSFGVKNGPLRPELKKRFEGPQRTVEGSSIFRGIIWLVRIQMNSNHMPCSSIITIINILCKFIVIFINHVWLKLSKLEEKNIKLFLKVNFRWIKPGYHNLYYNSSKEYNYVQP